MGNAMITPCFRGGAPVSSVVKLISFGGDTTILTGKHLAGEIMFEFPDRMVCPADSFFIGQPIPSLAIGDELRLGHTYFLLPLDLLTRNALSASTLAALGASIRARHVSFKDSPFEYVKGSDGRVLIKVVPEFVARLISRDDRSSDGDKCSGNRLLCSTPELQKHYDQLVRNRDYIWSPKLETISEHKIRFSPYRFMGLEWKQKEVN